MAINPMQRKTRNSFLLGMVITLLICSIAIGILVMQFMKLKDEQAKINKTVCVLVNDIKSGGTITSADVMQIKVEYAPSNPATMTDLAAEEVMAKTDLAAGVVLSQDMIMPVDEGIQNDVRLQEFNMITLPSQLEIGDYIDIRLTIPSGQDYVVLTKKQVVNCDTDTVWINLSEDEILTMNNAIVESYIMTGSNLYAVTYTEPGLQTEAIPTYPVSSVVVSTMAKNPNILDEAIEEFNRRNAENDPTEDRAAIDRNISSYNETRLENIETGVQEQKLKAQEKRLQYIEQLNAAAVLQ